MKRFFAALTLAAGLTWSLRADSILVVNAASYIRESSLAPGAIISVFGDGLTNTTAFATDRGNLPRVLGGVTLNVGGVSSVLFYVSPTQVNARIDESVRAGTQAVVLTSPTGAFTTSITVEITARPGLFSFSATGTRDGAILNAVTFAPGPFAMSTGSSPTLLAIFGTGTDLSAAPRVTIGGVVVPVQFAGNAPCCVGLEQINAQLTDELAGAGRVEVAVTARGKISNIVEATILPREGTKLGNRELAALAVIPASSLALAADEAGDVILVVDVSARKVIRTIALAPGSQPAALAVNAAGTLAVTTERNNGRVAIIDLATFTVSAEVAVGGGPSSVAIDGNQALVVNQDTDSVSLIDLSAKTVTKTIAMGRGPRSIAVDAAGGKAYVTNQDVGTISVISLATLSVINTFDLGAEARPQTIQVIPSLNMAVITDPSAGPEGRVWIVNLLLGTTTFVGLHKDRTGGASAVALNGTIAFFASQAARTVTVVPVDLISGGVLPFNTVQIQVGLGPRALAIDLRDNLLLVLNEGSGIITLIDLNTNLVVGTIDVTN